MLLARTDRDCFDGGCFDGFCFAGAACCLSIAAFFAGFVVLDDAGCLPCPVGSAACSWPCLARCCLPRMVEDADASVPPSPSCWAPRSGARCCCAPRPSPPPPPAPPPSPPSVGAAGVSPPSVGAAGVVSGPPTLGGRSSRCSSSDAGARPEGLAATSSSSPALLLKLPSLLLLLSSSSSSSTLLLLLLLLLLLSLPSLLWAAEPSRVATLSPSEAARSWLCWAWSSEEEEKEQAGPPTTAVSETGRDAAILSEEEVEGLSPVPAVLVALLLVALMALVARPSTGRGEAAKSACGGR